MNSRYSEQREPIAKMASLQIKEESSVHKRNISKQKTLKTHVRKFAENTTAHGYGHIANSRSVLYKIFWILIIITCHVIITVQVIPLVQKYRDKPIISSVTIRREKYPEFPVVVVCNNNIVLKDKIEDLKKEISTFYSSYDANFSVNSISYRSINALADKIGRRIFQYGHRFENFIHECEWLGNENCKHHDWYSYWHDLYGACFAYNSYFMPAKRVRNIGPVNSLKLLLNIEREKYSNLTKSVGVRVFIANRGSFYLPHDKGLSFKPGNEYSLAFRKHEIIRVKDCLSHQKARFYLHGHAFTAKYNSDICSQLCLAELMIGQCDCVDAHLPRISNSTKQCNELHAACILNVTRRFEEEGTPCESGCLPTCHEVYFPVDVSSMEFPLESNLYNISNSKENLMSLVIYFDTLNVRVTQDQFFYNIEDLLSDIGGQLGLFSGYSVLTVIEYMVLLTAILKTLSMRCFSGN